MSLCDVTIDWDLDPNYLYTWGASTFMLGAIPIPGGNRYRIILDEFSNHGISLTFVDQTKNSSKHQRS